MSLSSEHLLTALPDGTTIFIRPIRPDDAPRLQAMHARLSAESIRLRFLNLHLELSDAEARRLASVDGESAAAFVAVATAADEAVVGVARYARLGPARPGSAEAAVIVEDRYQGQGLGTALVAHLLDYARAHGVAEFVAEVSCDNERMLRFIRRSGYPGQMSLRDGAWEVRVNIAATAQSEPAGSRKPLPTHR
jgi:RimJ/RimL family protein N-acetyltransferase